MTEHFPDATGGGLALNGYAAGQVFLEAFSEMTADGAMPSREAYIETLESFGTREVGVIPALTYTEERHAGPTQSYLVQWTGDEWRIVQEPTEHPTGPVQ